MQKALLSLVGAGPGDIELITIKAVKAIRTADVILYDALANPGLLNYARPTCIKQFVGKKAGCHATSQKEINTLIIEFAQSYARIVRLKGGDPFVFGRSQEEIDTATAAGMEVEVIPGISSALAVPAMQMIPLTCRGISDSFWVVSGTTASGEISKDLFLAAQSSATVVILMGMRRLKTIMDIFSLLGRAETPVAIIQNGTTAEEKIVIGTVKDVYLKANAANMSNPAIIVIGEVIHVRGITKLKQKLLAHTPLTAVFK